MDCRSKQRIQTPRCCDGTVGCRDGTIAKLPDQGGGEVGRRVEVVMRITRTVRAGIGYLTVGAIAGAAISWSIADYWITRTATERFWYPPGRSEAWRLYAAVLGAVVGTAMGMLLEVVCSWARRRYNRRRDSHAGADSIPRPCK